MALARLSGRFGGPSNRAYRRRRARAGLDDGGGPEAADPGERRQRRRRYISIGLGVFLLAVIFGVVIVGYYREFFNPPRVWAGRVNDVEFTMGDLVQRIRVLQGVKRHDGGRVDLSTVPFEYLQDLINAEILRQAAPGLGIEPSDMAIQDELRRRFQPAPPEGQEVDPGQLEQEFRNNFQIFLNATGLTESEYRVIVEEELADFGLFLLMGQEIESPQEHVEVSWIRLPLDPSQAGAGGLEPSQVAQRIEVEPFETVAREVSVSAGYAAPDGHVGWVPRGAFPNLDKLLYGDEAKGTAPLNPGGVSLPEYTEDGIYIIKVLSGVDTREVEDRMRIKLAHELTEDWKNQALQQGLENETVQMHFNDRLYSWVADQVFVTAPRVPVTSGTGQ